VSETIDDVNEQPAPVVAGRGPPAWLRPLFMAVYYLPPVGFIVAVVISLVRDGSTNWQSNALAAGLTWLVGVAGFVFAGGHLFYPETTAEMIGWPTSPFQWEIGLANLGIGVLGAMATSFDRDFWLATIVAFSIYYLGAAVGHVREMITSKNFAPGNAGYAFWFDVLAPAVLIALYIWTA
jgi:hypothetical protein